MDKIIDKIYDLYVLNTNKYLIQKPGGEYSTITYKKRNTVGARPLLPYIIQQHLNQKKTVGIFAGSYYTKFICFDKLKQLKTYRENHLLYMFYLTLNL